MANCSRLASSVRRVILILAVGLLLPEPLKAAEMPQQILARYGLRQEADQWTLPEHRRLSRLLDRFDAVLRDFHRSDQIWREQVERIESLERQLHSLETKYEENRRLIQQQAGNPVVHRKLQEQQGQLSQRMGELRLTLKKRQSNDGSELYDSARRHAAARAELIATTAAIEHAHLRLADRHASVAASDAVRQALSDLRASTGVSHELAPVDFLAHKVETALRRADKPLQAQSLPLLLRGDKGHLTVLAAGQPATFAVDDEHAQTLVPLSHAERLGIVLDEVMLWQSQMYGEREVRLLSAKLSTLQVGSAKLRDVEVYISSAEDADLGLRLGSDVLDRIDLRVERGRARIELSPPMSAHGM